MTSQGLWYSYTLKPYLLKEEAFYDATSFGWTQILEQNFEVFKAEVLNFIQEEKLTPYFNKSLLSKKNSWKTDGLLHWGYFAPKHYHYFQKSWNLLKEIPGLVSFSVSMLEPQSKIKQHCGDTNAIIRIHLPIVVPKGLPECGLTVDGIEKEWQEGKVLMFNDAQQHSAKNESDERRIVLILDVIRPEFLAKKYEVSARVINGLIWQWMTQKNPKVRKLPMWCKKLMWACIRFGMKMILKYHKQFRWP